jgi:hypothetical protein
MMRLCVIILVLGMSSCSFESKSNLPLITVIKLHSLEEEKELNYEGFEKLIDFESVYGNCENDTLSAKECWCEIVKFQYSLARDKKITNNNRYYDYKIESFTRDDLGYVTFLKEGKGERFILEYRKGNWVIVKRERLPIVK